MIALQLKDWRRYQGWAELREAFEFLERHSDGSGLADGRHEIAGDRVYALMIAHQPKPAQECRFETHQRYADVVYLASGSEMIGYAPAETLAPAGEYDGEKDLAFYETPEFFTPVLLKAGGARASSARRAGPSGMVTVFYPEDGHMPGCIYEREEVVKKIVVKVKVA